MCYALDFWHARERIVVAYNRKLCEIKSPQETLIVPEHLVKVAEEAMEPWLIEKYKLLYQNAVKKLPEKIPHFDMVLRST